MNVTQSVEIIIELNRNLAKLPKRGQSESERDYLAVMAALSAAERVLYAPIDDAVTKDCLQRINSIQDGIQRTKKN